MSLLLFGLVGLQAQAAFTSLYVFGDGVSTTTNNTLGGSLYYGQRYSNGRVWVEVLAERQGLTYESNKNWSYFGDYSSDLLANLNNFPAPADANTALFVVWVINADFVYNVNTYPTDDTVAWSNAVIQSVTNQWRAITNLYAKGARTLIMPNAVDLMKVPAYVYTPSADKTFVQQRIVDFNIAFAGMLNQARTSFSNLTIYAPDLFSLLNDIVTNSASYGLTNALLDGQSVAALDDPMLQDFSLNGPGTNHIFWDDLDPSAKAHAVLADVVQQLISPVRFSKIIPTTGSNRLEVVNIPIGRNGLLESSTNLLDWTVVQSCESTNTTRTFFVPRSDSHTFYRLRFPLAWTWP
jgi:phospholipase/lecithinase/hemolysin